MVTKDIKNTLTSEDKKVKLIRKSNDLVEGRYRFDIWEMRVFTKMLMLIHKDDEDFKEYRIYLKDLVKEFGIKDKNAYEWIKKGSEGLMKKEITIERETPDGIMEFKTYIAVGVDSFKAANGKFVDISFHPKMKPLLLQLQTQFLMYDVQNVLGLQSGFSVRIYELLKQYERIGKRKFNVKELKEILDISDKYPLYGNFKQRIIQKAQEDLEAYTDIRFEFEEIKFGKAVEEIMFYIFKNKGKTLDYVADDTHANLPDIDLEELFDLVKNWKSINKNTLKDWLLKYEKDYIKYRINLVQNLLSVDKKIKNPMGYVQKLLSQTDLFDTVQEEKDKQLMKEQQAKKIEQERSERIAYEQAQKQHRQSFEEAKKELIISIFTRYPHIPKQYIENLRNMRQQANPPFIIEMAFDHYVTGLTGVESGSMEEIVYNYDLGGSFSALLSDWIETNFKEEYEQLLNRFK